MNDVIELNESIEQRINCVSGTLAIEGISISDISIENIKRYVTKQATYEELLDEIIARHKDLKKFTNY